jgi:hypothetical protein
MSFKLVKYKEPDFSQSQFTDAPDAVTAPAPKDKVAPEHYHATTIFPEYFKVKGQWLLAEESRTAWQCTRMGRFMSGSLGT